MREHAQMNSYSAELKKSAKAIKPSKEQCDRILQSVLEAVDEEETSYEVASKQVSRMSAFRVVHGLKDAVVSRTGLVVVAAGLLLAVCLSQALPSQFIEIEDMQTPLAELPGGIAAHYTVEPVQSASGVAVEDGTIPTVKNYQVDADSMAIYFDNTDSGVDWSSLAAEDFQGNSVAPLEVDEATSMVRFALPKKDLLLYIANFSGNRAQFAIRVIR